MSTGVDVFADLSLKIGSLTEQMQRQNDEARRRRETARARVPAIVRLSCSGTIPSPSVSFGLNFGGPDAGFEWVVRRIIVGGLTWTTTAAGTAEVYVTGLGGGTGTTGSGTGTVASIRSLSDLVDQSATIPNKAFYGRDELVVKENESLVVVVVNGTASQEYVASCGVQVVRTAAALAGSLYGI